MDRGAIVDAIARITGTWSPAGAATDADRDAARRALADPLAAETYPDDVHAALAARSAVGEVAELCASSSAI